MNSFKTKDMEIDIENGSITKLANLLTGETYTSSCDTMPSSGLMPLPDIYPSYSSELEFGCDGGIEPVPFDDPEITASDDSLIYKSRKEESRWLNMKFQKNESVGGISVQQSGGDNLKGIYGVQFSIGGIKKSLDFIYPGMQGIGTLLNESHPDKRIFTRRSVQWPSCWSAAMCIIQGDKGGVVIFADDPEHNFKEMSIFSNDENNCFGIGFISCNPAPFDDRHEISSVKWNIVPYAGDWRKGAQIYKDHIMSTAKWTRLDEHPVKWVNAARFYVLFDSVKVLDDLSVLDRLSEKIPPEKTVCYVRHWRFQKYDEKYPDYTPSDAGKRFISYGRKLGFHMQPHLDLYGVTPGQVEYDLLEKYQIRNPFTEKPIGWQWEKESDLTRFAAISPASSKFREIFIKKCEETIESTACDSILTDVAWWTINDGQGLIDGMNEIQGLERMLSEMHMSLPSIPFGSEGSNEIICRNEIYGHINNFYAKEKPSYIHPVYNFIFGEYAYQIMHYAFKTQDCTESIRDVNQAGEEMLYRLGSLPSYVINSISDVTAPSEATKQLFERAKLWCRFEFVNDYSFDWPEGAVMAWISNDGRRMVARLENPGVGLYWLDDSGEILISSSITSLLEYM
ncbi:MAG: hypothetical protein ACYCYI_11635 [Saccharofermentanales bacterium]